MIKLDVGAQPGDLYDNLAVYSHAVQLMHCGQQDAGRRLLMHLQRHICATKELKSTVHLLPSIHGLLQPPVGSERVCHQ